MADTVAGWLGDLFPLINKAFQVFKSTDEWLVIGHWDRCFAEVLEEDFDVFNRHKTGDSITSSLWVSCVKLLILLGKRQPLRDP